MNSSADISRGIYQQLRAEGLAERTSPDWDRRTVALVDSLLPRRRGLRILDAGCGYGRIAIPLLGAGREVIGVDVSPRMLSAAAAGAAAAGVRFPLCLGDVCRLPFGEHTFDVALCMWMTFNELLQRHEQIAALCELRRVLRPGGVGLLDGTPFRESLGSRENLAAAIWATRGDGESPAPVPKDDPVGEVYAELLEESGIERFELFVHDCPGRARYFLRFWRT